MTGANRSAFTLIELLVVITIIVVLLALLTPAMDKAIYQVELATCGAQLKAVATGVTAYAMDNGRVYANTPNWQYYFNFDLMVEAWGLLNRHDVRPLLRPYLPIKTMVDPMVKSVDLDLEVGNWVQNSYYSLWFGVQYPGHAGLRRVGDAFDWDIQEPSGQTRVATFDLLVSDTDFYTNQNSGIVYGSHPDDLGRMANVQAQADAVNPGSITYSYWQNAGGQDRGRVDHNYAHGDGSVDRVTGITARYDVRLKTVPGYRNAANWPVYYEQLPER